MFVIGNIFGKIELALNCWKFFGYFLVNTAK